VPLDSTDATPPGACAPSRRSRTPCGSLSPRQPARGSSSRSRSRRLMPTTPRLLARFDRRAAVDVGRWASPSDLDGLVYIDTLTAEETHGRPRSSASSRASSARATSCPRTTLRADTAPVAASRPPFEKAGADDPVKVRDATRVDQEVLPVIRAAELQDRIRPETATSASGGCLAGSCSACSRATRRAAPGRSTSRAARNRRSAAEARVIPGSARI